MNWTEQLINQVKRIETRTSIAPDHKAIFLSIEIDQAPARGSGNWKFNNALLKDNDYINLIKSNYPFFQEKYQHVESRQLYWELLKMEIRSTTIAYSKKKKFNLRNRETIIQRKLEELDTEICSNQNLDGDILMEFENLKNELTEIYSVKGKEAMFRSRTRWIENGEKPFLIILTFSTFPLKNRFFFLKWNVKTIIVCSKKNQRLPLQPSSLGSNITQAWKITAKNYSKIYLTSRLTANWDNFPFNYYIAF